MNRGAHLTDQQLAAYAAGSRGTEHMADIRAFARRLLDLRNERRATVGDCPDIDAAEQRVTVQLDELLHGARRPAYEQMERRG